VEALRDDKDLKIQRAITYAVHAVRAKALHADLCARAGPCADQDLVAACSKDQGHTVFFARLSDHDNRLLPEELVCWTRRFLQLPPLTRLGNALPRAHYDYDMEECLGEHNEAEDSWLDIYGTHDNSQCAPTMHGKHKGHTLLKYVVDRFARMVPGVRSQVEPHTHDILDGQYSEADCRRLFRKYPSAAHSKTVKEITDELDKVRAMPAGQDRDAAAAAANAKMEALNTNITQKDRKSVRLDVQLCHGSDELLIDATITHSLSKSARQAECKRTLERLQSGIARVKDLPARAIETARAKKQRTYGPLVYILKKQVVDGRRPKEPLVEPMAVTTFGELGPGCTLVQEWLAMRLKAHLLAQPARPDGRDPAKITGRFRADFRLAIVMVCARRAAAMQLGSGLPHASIRGLRPPAPAVDDFIAVNT
jgi:hypothetical protein